MGIMLNAVLKLAVVRWKSLNAPSQNVNTKATLEVAVKAAKLIIGQKFRKIKPD